MAGPGESMTMIALRISIGAASRIRPASAHTISASRLTARYPAEVFPRRKDSAASGKEDSVRSMASADVPLMLAILAFPRYLSYSRLGHCSAWLRKAAPPPYAVIVSRTLLTYERDINAPFGLSVLYNV